MKSHALTGYLIRQLAFAINRSVTSSNSRVNISKIFLLSLILLTIYPILGSNVSAFDLCETTAKSKSDIFSIGTLAQRDMGIEFLKDKVNQPNIRELINNVLHYDVDLDLEMRIFFESIDLESIDYNVNHISVRWLSKRQCYILYSVLSIYRRNEQPNDFRHDIVIGRLFDEGWNELHGRIITHTDVGLPENFKSRLELLYREFNLSELCFWRDDGNQINLENDVNECILKLRNLDPSRSEELNTLISDVFIAFPNIIKPMTLSYWGRNYIDQMMFLIAKKKDEPILVYSERPDSANSNKRFFLAMPFHKRFTTLELFIPKMFANIIDDNWKIKLPEIIENNFQDDFLLDTNAFLFDINGKSEHKLFCQPELALCNSDLHLD
ncbi:uncharacterized protein HLK63_D06919 [Nakaseomyces glabratus]|nr:uncharacterized protein GW608_D06919 [Nakaseomyces glabratus]UCS24910.1 uncharacterized protein HLK63_D06919 [Nakaseomyces glabratus]UCS30140.1 uncharacterized protein HLK64_D06919 [Nakaseomyces glabratus]UCS35368.1 uncharacterized protein HLK62_D06919 [Nakaseomyces glabratus]